MNIARRRFVHFFRRPIEENTCEVTGSGKEENRSDAKGMFVPCRLNRCGSKSDISVLIEELQKTV